MADSFTLVENVGAHFLSTYYKYLTKENIDGLVAMYSSEASVSFAIQGDAEEGSPKIFFGIDKAREYHHLLIQKYGERKIHVQNVDIIPVENMIVITCNGQFHCFMNSHFFSQTFVLAPTKDRENTYHIAGDVLRFHSDVREVAPEGAEVVNTKEYERIMSAFEELLLRDKAEYEEEERLLQERILAAAITAAAAKEAAAAAAAAIIAVTEEKQRRPQRAPRDPRREGTEKKFKDFRPRGLTSYVILRRVPQETKLSDCRKAGEAYGILDDALWIDQDCVLKYSTPAMAKEAVMNKIKVNGVNLLTSYHYRNSEGEINNA